MNQQEFQAWAFERMPKFRDKLAERVKEEGIELRYHPMGGNVHAFIIGREVYEIIITGDSVSWRFGGYVQ